MVASLCLASLARCEPPVLSNQYGPPPGNSYGAPGNGYGGGQGLTNSYGAPLDGGHHGGGGGGHDEHQDYIDSQVNYKTLD